MESKWQERSKVEVFRGNLKQGVCVSQPRKNSTESFVPLRTERQHHEVAVGHTRQCEGV